jgi:hypothetical protein
VQVTITNMSKRIMIHTPIGIVVDTLTPGVTYVPQTGIPSGTFGGWPWQGESGGQGALPPGLALTIPLNFSNPTNAIISFNPIVYTGTL